MAWDAATIGALYGVDTNAASAMRTLMMGGPGLYGTMEHGRFLRAWLLDVLLWHHTLPHPVLQQLAPGLARPGQRLPRHRKPNGHDGRLDLT